MKSSFQAGVDTLYNKCVNCGSTPSSKTPTAISNSIQSIYTNRYNSGYNAGDSAGYTRGYNAGKSASNYKIESGSASIKYTSGPKKVITVSGKIYATSVSPSSNSPFWDGTQYVHNSPSKGYGAKVLSDNQLQITSNQSDARTFSWFILYK